MLAIRHSDHFTSWFRVGAVVLTAILVGAAVSAPSAIQTAAGAITCTEADQSLGAKLKAEIDADWADSHGLAHALHAFGTARRHCQEGRDRKALAQYRHAESTLSMLERVRASKTSLAAGQ